MALIKISPSNMTANNSPSPYIASATAEYLDVYKAYFAFNSDSTQWVSSGTGGNLVIYLGSSPPDAYLKKIIIYGNTTANCNPYNFSIRGSNVGGFNDYDYEILYSTTSTSGWVSGEPKEFILSTPATTIFKYYSLRGDSSGGLFSIPLIELWGETLPWNYFSKRNGVTIANVNKIFGIDKTIFGKVNGITV